MTNAVRPIGSSAFEWSADSGWDRPLANARRAESFGLLEQFVARRRSEGTVFPEGGLVFRALQLTPLSNVQFVILGQDPYHGPGQAHGLCFSVPADNRIPPSLRNILKELQADTGIAAGDSGDLSAWARQGGLLLNAVLTVDAHQANSHCRQGWEQFTDEIISVVNQQPQNVAFVLWGKPAQKKRLLIDQQRHLVIEAPHPSPLSAHRGILR